MANQLVTNTPPAFDNFTDAAFIRQKDLYKCQIIPFSATTLWRKVKAGTFPEPERVSPNIVAWRCGSIRAWLKDPLNYSPYTKNAIKHP